MCQWRQWFPDDLDFRWSSCAPFSAAGSMWSSLGCSLQCHPPSYAVSRTEAVCMKCAGTRLTLLPSVGLCSRRLSRLQGWDRRLRWSFRLVISSFQKTDSRREDWPTQIRPPVRPNIHLRPGWVNASTVPRLQSGTDWNVSKAASPSKQSHIRTVLQSSPPLSLFKIKATLELYSLKTVFMLVIQRHPLKKQKRRKNILWKIVSKLSVLHLNPICTILICTDSMLLVNHHYEKRGAECQWLVGHQTAIHSEQ